MLQPRSPLQLLLQRDPGLFRTLARRARWGLFIGGALGVLMALLVIRNLEARCAAEAVGCELLRSKGPLMMMTVMQMAFFGAIVSTIGGIVRMLILGLRAVDERDQGLRGPDGRPVPREEAFHSSWDEPAPGAPDEPRTPDERPKTEAEKHLERFHRKK